MNGWCKKNGLRLFSGNGFTLLEVLIVVAMVGTLAGMAIPVYFNALEKARIVRATSEIRDLERVIKAFEITNGEFPMTLAEIGQQHMVDPWGNPYQYLKIVDAPNSIKGKVRKDRFLVPINSDFDLYSMGKDGNSVPPLTAKASRDDIVRANDGDFVGLASLY